MKTFKLPCLLGWGKEGEEPGRGEAGWTVYTFTTREERSAFMVAHQESRMPCWNRIERGEV